MAKAKKKIKGPMTRTRSGKEIKKPNYNTIQDRVLISDATANSRKKKAEAERKRKSRLKEAEKLKDTGADKAKKKAEAERKRISRLKKAEELKDTGADKSKKKKKTTKPTNKKPSAKGTRNGGCFPSTCAPSGSIMIDVFRNQQGD